MNKIVLTGRLVNEVELKKSDSGNSYTKYTIAVRRDNDNTDFIDCVTFGTFAEKLNEYIRKGDMLGIVGNLQINTYEKDGAKHKSYSVVTERIEFLSGKPKEEIKEAPKGVTSDTFEVTDDDLPF